VPYWYCKTLEKSTWDSPTMILAALLKAGLETDETNIVRDWNNYGDHFIQVILRGEKQKKKERHFVYIDRRSK
jgi:hypothetical protein